MSRSLPSYLSLFVVALIATAGTSALAKTALAPQGAAKRFIRVNTSSGHESAGQTMGRLWVKTRTGQSNSNTHLLAQPLKGKALVLQCGQDGQAIDLVLGARLPETLSKPFKTTGVPLLDRVLAQTTGEQLRSETLAMLSQLPGACKIELVDNPQRGLIRFGFKSDFAQHQFDLSLQVHNGDQTLMIKAIDRDQRSVIVKVEGIDSRLGKSIRAEDIFGDVQKISPTDLQALSRFVKKYDLSRLFTNLYGEHAPPTLLNGKLLQSLLSE
ncbi:MAG: hypothetical protein H6707_14845 [Deltaproteobacteria bacterium]|nr:hypothetical protein [Deltaproteobacteria bacterium]